MGSWGSGVFENDDAKEIIEEVASIIQGEIDGFQSSDRVGIEDFSALIACIKLESLLVSADAIAARPRSFTVSLLEKMEGILKSEGDFFSSERQDVIKEVLAEYLKLSVSD